jgi:hypothetical protein
MAPPCAQLTFSQLLVALILASFLTHVSVLAVMGRGLGLGGFVSWLNRDGRRTPREPYRDIMDWPRRAGAARAPEAVRPRKRVRPVPLIPDREDPPAQHLAPFPAPLSSQRLYAVGRGRRVRPVEDVN